MDKSVVFAVRHLTKNGHGVDESVGEITLDFRTRYLSARTMSAVFDLEAKGWRSFSKQDISKRKQRRA